MASKTVMMYDDQDLGSTANQVKELVVAQLVHQEKLTQKDANAFNARYAVVVVKKGWLGSTIDKALGLEKDTTRIYQIISLGK
jgi:hypothetical protein